MAQIHQIQRKLKNRQPFFIRNAEEKDASQLLQLIRDVTGECEYQVTTSEELTVTVEQEKHWIGAMKGSVSSLALVAEYNGAIIGMIDFHGNTRRRRLAHTGQFGMSVLEIYRDQGVGSALIEALLHWATEHPIIEKVTLAVFANNERAIHVYQKHGFLIEGRRVREIKISDSEYVDDILMYKLVKANATP